MSSLSKMFSKHSVRRGHTLIVPFNHTPFTQFKNGIPVEQVRELAPTEKKWNFWTTSTAFYPTVPKTLGAVQVPEGEVWIVEKGGKFSKALPSGSGFVLPFFEKIKTVKLSTTISSGVIANGVTTKSGASVDVYAVIYFKVTDPVASAYYLDPETNLLDSERTAAKLTRKLLTSEVSKVSAVTDSEKATIAASILKSLKEKEATFGLEFSQVELRGAFAVEENVGEKIRAMEAPHPDFTTPGHDLPNDYWAPLLTPAFFEKMTYGSAKKPKTPAAVSLEWSVPSPPDFHHFNEIPKLTVAPKESGAPKVAATH